MELKDLNYEQKEAVTFGEGPLLIVAGAGTGKTTVITQRIAWLIEHKKVKTEEILALTFTEKAADEMEERVDRLLSYGYVDLWVSTFHAFGERILKESALEIGLDPGFKLLSQAEQWQFLRQNLEKFNLDYYKPLGNPTKFIQALIQHFSRVKDENIAPEEYIKYGEKLVKKAKDSAPEEEAKKILEVARAFRTYHELMTEEGNFDFGDLIIYTLKLFQKRPSVLEKYRKQFKYILVDEFQDTNYAQYELVKILAAPKNNLTVTGDDDQSIYKFRGASISNILEFKRDFPESKEVILIKNYRSKQNILDLTYDFIQLNNPYRLEAQLKDEKKFDHRGQSLESKVSKRLKATRQGQAEIGHLHFETAEEEVLGVVKKIAELRKKHKKLSWGDFAILLRANNQADAFIQMLSANEIPYQFMASRGLYAKPEILDLIAYLKMLDNYHESASLYRVLSLPIFKFNLLEVMKLLHYARKKSLSLFEALEGACQIPQIQFKTLNLIEQLLAQIKKHTELTKTKTVGQVLYRFLKDSGYLKNLTKKTTPENSDKILNINKFFRKIEEFERTHEDKSVKAFLAYYDLAQEAGEEAGPAQLSLGEGLETLKILTVHSAKGLEFTYVFVVNLVDKRFPTIERKDPIELPDELIKEIVPEGDIHLQEERRLFYVACTRAKDGLYLTSAEDYGGARKKKLSRFLVEAGLAKKEVPQEREKELIQYHGSQELPLKWKKTKKQDLLVLPSRFSFTQLKTFETCPKQYRYAHILMVPVPSRHTFSFGKTIHKTLKDFYELVGEKEKVSLEELLEIYERNWIPDWYDSKEHMEQRKKRGREVLTNFYQLHQGKFKKPKFLEKPFRVKIDDYTLKGVIDRIDVVSKSEKGEEVEIIDYKTGQLPKDKKYIDLEQLWIYALAVEEVFGDKPKYLTYYYLESNEKLKHPFKKEEIEKIKERVRTTIERIYQSDFKATPNIWKCKNCDFQDICEDKKI